tara:strand:- start:114677 stop:115150 length:474 start_codon:yes stop_codon:yes gene_type:complete
LIRLATDADAPAIAAIWNPVIACTTITFTPDEKTAAQVVDLITPQTPCLVAVHAGQVAGFARYGPFRGGAGYRFSAEHTILLHPSARGQGIGRILLGALCDHAQGAGLHMLHAGISAENPRAVEFHASCGFRTLAVLPEVGFKFGRWIDLVLMQKRL